MEKESETKMDYVSDEIIRKNSIYNKMSSTAKAQLLFKNKDKTSLEFHVVNKRDTLDRTFKIIILEDYDTSMQALLGYQSLFVSLFCLVVCCSCGVKCIKFLHKKCRRMRCFNRNNNAPH